MKKIIWFGLGGLLLVRKGFSKAARVAFSSDMLLKIKNSLFTFLVAWHTGAISLPPGDAIFA